jgi:stage II sporulation SpoE-like protein
LLRLLRHVGGQVILALPDGTTRVPELPAGQSLGLGTAIYGRARIRLPPGAVLALYTDGLVESRTRSFDQGILALRSIRAREHGNLETICDALITSLAGRREDDITVILAPSVPRSARRFCRTSRAHAPVLLARLPWLDAGRGPGAP